jgi:riboflavin biosynthesis pyrimidine reductase
VEPATPATEPLHVLYEAAGLAAYRLPAGLRTLYGGDLGFAGPTIYANFVSSLDGVAALDDAVPAGPLISGGSVVDRFVMGLLRACADAVLVGAGTLRAERDHVWTPGFIYPAAAADYRLLRRHLGRDGEPVLVVVSARGDIDPSAPSLELGAHVITTAAGAARLQGRLPGAVRVSALPGDGRLEPADVVGAVRAEGHSIVLTEGGPHLAGDLVAGGLVDELFLTLSPVLAGRDGRRRRMGLVEGAVLLPAISSTGSLMSARRAASHLFLRYDLRRWSSAP